VSQALDSLLEFRRIAQSLPDPAADPSRTLRKFVAYLKNCSGATPFEAIASDEMPQAQQVIADIVSAYPLVRVVRVMRALNVPIAVRHWCLSLAVAALAAASDEDERIEYVVNSRGLLAARFRGIHLATLADLTGTVYRTDYEGGVLTVEVQVPPGFLFDDERLRYYSVAWQTSQVLQPTGEYAGYHVFGHQYATGMYFRLQARLTPQLPDTSIAFRAAFPLDGRVHSASLRLGYRGASHLALAERLVWRAGRFAIAGMRRAIAVRQVGSKRSRIVAELGIARTILARGMRRRRLRLAVDTVLVRALYWLTRKRYREKNIWFLHDKMYSASDCGEYMYWFLESEAPEVTPVFAMNKDAMETPRLVKAGARLAYPGTIRQALLYLHARVVLTTHPNPANVAGINRFSPYLRDLTNAPVVCIQHGLTMQDIARVMHKGHAGIRRYYCASPHEIEHLASPAYGYDREDLVLTGIPRFDGLPRSSEPVILISPTWRPEYAAPSPGGNNRRPEYDDFLNSRYFERFSELLLTPALLEAASARGYRLRFMLHPTLATNLQQFIAGLHAEAERRGIATLLESVVDVVGAGVDASYDEELKRARLLVTDYSGIQYDFAYMRKAIVYYHASDMPPQYGEGAMDYATMGFGPIASTIEQVAAELVGALARDCAPRDDFRPRYESFFAFDDQDSRRRIYEDLRDWLAARERKKRPVIASAPTLAAPEPAAALPSTDPVSREVRP